MHGLNLLFVICSFYGFSHGDLTRIPGEQQNPDKQIAINTKEKKISVEITATQTSAYCGGVRPSPDILKELQNPKPLMRKRLFIKRGDKNMFSSKIFIEACTDSSGKIQLMLLPGKYFIVDELKKDTSYYKTLIRKYSKASKNHSAIEKECLKSWYEQPDMVFEIINSDMKNLNLNFHKPCDWKEIPCIQYNGPLHQ